MPYILKSCYSNDLPNIGSVNLTQHIYLPCMSNLCDIKWICSSDFHGQTRFNSSLKTAVLVVFYS